VACAVAAIVVVVVGVVLIVDPDATNIAVALLVLVASAAYVVQRARRRGRLTWGDLPFVVVALLAGTSFFLGRTGSFACRPSSWFQYHGLWHIGTAVLAAVWAITSLDRARLATAAEAPAHA
jgi:hypothetical protein